MRFLLGTAVAVLLSGALTPRAFAADGISPDLCSNYLLYDLTAPTHLDPDEVHAELILRGAHLGAEAERHPIRHDIRVRGDRRIAVPRAEWVNRPEISIPTFATHEDASWPLTLHYKIVENELEVIANVSGRTWRGYEALIEERITPHFARTEGGVHASGMEFDRFRDGRRPAGAAPDDVGYVRIVYRFSSRISLENKMAQVARLLVALRQ